MSLTEALLIWTKSNHVLSTTCLTLPFVATLRLHVDKALQQCGRFGEGTRGQDSGLSLDRPCKSETCSDGSRHFPRTLLKSIFCDVSCQCTSLLQQGPVHLPVYLVSLSERVPTACLVTLPRRPAGLLAIYLCPRTPRATNQPPLTEIPLGPYWHSTGGMDNRGPQASLAHPAR